MKNKHRALLGAAALSLTVAGSLAGARPAKADTSDTICTTECGPGTLRGIIAVLVKLDNLDQKWTSRFDKTSPLESVMSKIEDFVMYKVQ